MNKTMQNINSYWNKFVLLMWKNVLLLRRHKLQTFLEIITPVIFSGLLVMIRILVQPEIITESTRYHEITLNNINHLRIKLFNQIEYKLVYSPYNEKLDDLISRSVKHLELDGYESVKNSRELQKYLLLHNFVAGIEFPDGYVNITKLPNNFIFQIRYPAELRTANVSKIRDNNWATNMAFPIWDVGGSRNDKINDGGLPPGYFAEGFLDIQNCISKVFIEIKTSIEKMPQIAIQVCSL